MQEGNLLCEAGSVGWIETWFGDCVYTRWDLMGFCVGLSSIFFWMIAQMPQIFSNFLRQSADALSPWFLFQWLAGDSLNLLGCVLTGDQLATETFTAYYFILSDCLIISQYLYYQARNKDRNIYFDESVHKPGKGYQTIIHVSSDSSGRNCEDSAHKSRNIQNKNILATLASDTKADESASETDSKVTVPKFADTERKAKQDSQHQLHGTIDKGGDTKHILGTRPSTRQVRRVVLEYGLEYGPTSVRIQGRRLHSLKKGICVAGTVMGIPGSHASTLYTSSTRKFLLGSSNERLMWVKETGLLFGWISSGLYLGSRISQLIKNSQRKSAEGLSLAMVTCAVLANLTYGAAILMRFKSWEDLLGKAPWLVGSLGTVSLDISIFLQAQYLSYRYPTYSTKSEPNERTPLLLVSTT